MDPFDRLWDEKYLREEVTQYFGEFDESRWSLEAGMPDDRVRGTSHYTVEEFNRHTQAFVYQSAWNCAINSEKEKYVAIRDVIAERGLGRVLDYGCGIGSGVITLALAGNYVIGAEVNKHCLGFLGERIRRFGLQSKAVMLDLLKGPKVESIGPFSAIVCTEVFEHVEDPHGLARLLLHDLLKPDGVAVLSWSFTAMGGNLLGHLPQHFHLQAPHPNQLLTMGFGKFMQDELNMEFQGYSWFNNMIWVKE